MKKQLIVVVHGVGVRDAGVVTGQLSAALGGETSPERSAAAPWHPHSTDDFLLHEDDRFVRNGLLPIFPAHLRRFRRYEPGDRSTVRQERVIADFFWGDISGTGLGGLQVVVGLIKIVLGLSHAIRENAMDVFPGTTARAVWLRRIARMAPLIIHGPIAALNLMLIAGLILTLVVHAVNGRGFDGVQAEAAPIAVQLVFGLATILLCRFGLHRAQVFLLRHLLSWLMAAGVLVIVVAGVQVALPHLVERAMVLANEMVFATVCRPADIGCVLGTAGYVVPGAVMMGAMMLAWAVTLLSAVVVQIATWGRGWFPERGQVQPLVQPAIALMTILWFVMMTAGWAVILLIHWAISSATGFLLPQGLSIGLVHASLRLVTPAILALVVLGGVALVLHLRKAAAFAKFPPEEYLLQRDDLARTHRLIVGRSLLVVLTVFTAVMVVMGVVANVADCRILPVLSCADIMKWNNGLIPTLTAIVGVMALLLGMIGRQGLATGVAIFTDVLVYLNDYSWRSREAMPGTDEAPRAATHKTRTFTERAMGMRTDPGTRRQGYWLRERIHSRMQVLMETLIRDEVPEEIIIVSHSQGTMIALDVIEARGKHWLGSLPPGGRLKLVTMGSPYIHLYNSYFPSLFADLARRPQLQKVTAGGLLTEWVNIFRVDDFVGTHIDTSRNEGQPNDGTGWPQEVPVPPNGHTNYWADVKVMPPLLRVLRY